MTWSPWHPERIGWSWSGTRNGSSARSFTFASATIKNGPVIVTLEPSATITGRVSDADGNPVSGASIRIYPQPGGEFSLRLDRVASNKEGRFVVPDVPIGCKYTLVAESGIAPKESRVAFFKNATVRPGESTDVGEVRFEPSTTQATQSKPAIDRVGVNAMADKSKEIAPKAAEPSKMPIAGRIVDLEGRPVAGATVQIRQITKPKGDDLTPWIEAVKRGEPPWTAYNHLVYEPPISPEDKRPKATTDAQGRFRFDGLAAERLVELVIQGPTIAFTPVEVITRRVEPIPASGFPSQHGPGSQTIHGADFTFTAVPGRPVEGIIRDAKTNQPMAGVEVRSEHFAGSNFAGINDLRTRTDAQGHFRLVGFPKGRGNQLLIVPNDDQPYFMQEVDVPDPLGIAPVPVEIALHMGIWIQGKVTDKETGKPVPGTWLHYFPFLDNKFAQATPEFGPGREVDGTSYQDRYQTKADGTYRLVGLRGRAIVGAVSHSEKPYLRGAGFESIKGMDQKGILPTYFNPVYISRFFPHSMKEINPPDGAEVVHLDLELYSGAKARLRVVDSQGKPVVGVKAAGRIGRGAYDRKDQEAEFDVLNLAPGEDRMVLVRHEGRKLGKAVHVHEGDDQERPCDRCSRTACEYHRSLDGRGRQPGLRGDQSGPTLIPSPQGASPSAWARSPPTKMGSSSFPMCRLAVTTRSRASRTARSKPQTKRFSGMPRSDLANRPTSARFDSGRARPSPSNRNRQSTELGSTQRRTSPKRSRPRPPNLRKSPLIRGSSGPHDADHRADR